MLDFYPVAPDSSLPILFTERAALADLSPVAPGPLLTIVFTERAALADLFEVLAIFAGD